MDAKQVRKAAIIVAGGSGRRMGSALPKQFIEVNGKPVLQHTIERFYNFDPAMQLVVVLPGDYHAYWREECKKHRFTVKYTVVSGGEERFFSVSNGLDALDADVGLVAVHDGVRPLVSPATIERCFAVALAGGAAIPTTQPTESLRQISPDGSTHSVVRSQYLCVQTPQCFARDIIARAYSLPFSSQFTDDASVVEAAGHSIATVPGNVENIKITTPIDLVVAEHLLK